MKAYSVFKFLYFVLLFFLAACTGISEPVLFSSSGGFKVDRFGFKLSPDGSRLVWVEQNQTKVELVAGTLEGRILGRTNWHRNVQYGWFQDSRHLFAELVKNNEKESTVALLDTDKSDLFLAQLNIAADGRPGIFSPRFSIGSDRLVFVSNIRDHSIFDSFIVKINFGAMPFSVEAVEYEVNPGDVAEWFFDAEGKPKARTRRISSGEFGFEMRRGQNWKELWRQSDTTVFQPTSWQIGDKFFASSNRNRDRVALVEVDSATGTETPIFAHDSVDLDTPAIAPHLSKPAFAMFTPGFQQLVTDDPMLEQMASKLHIGAYFFVTHSSRDYRDRFLTIEGVTPNGTYKAFLFNRQTGGLRLLSATAIQDRSVKVQAVSYHNRDGVLIHAYLLLPETRNVKNLPALVVPHGGPWERNSPNPGILSGRLAQQGYLSGRLAQQGYAVLLPDYRGSTGYGKSFLEAGVRDFGTGMVNDLEDGAKWLVENGYADAKRIAIGGGSFGGYLATLAISREETPFAAAISLSGVTDLETLLNDGPAYWELGKDIWFRAAGNPATEEGRKRLRELSPLTYSDRVKKPVLLVHGDMDGRTNKSQSQRFFAALQAQGRKDVEYIELPQAGHGGFSNENLEKWAKASEVFLSKYLNPSSKPVN